MTLREQVIERATETGHFDLAKYMVGAIYNRANFAARLRWLNSVEAA